MSPEPSEQSNFVEMHILILQSKLQTAMQDRHNALNLGALSAQDPAWSKAAIFETWVVAAIAAKQKRILRKHFREIDDIVEFFITPIDPKMLNIDLGVKMDTREKETFIEKAFANGVAAMRDERFSDAAKHFNTAAEHGAASAQNNLGVLFRNGQGVPKDYLIAYKWFCLAAEQGNSEAQCSLGELYLTGKGVQLNYSESKRWYSLSAEQDDMTACIMLGVIFADGHGVKKNYKKAYYWFHRAEALGHDTAGEMIDSLVVKMTPADLSKAQILTRKWIETHKER